MKFGSVCSGIEAASAAWHQLGWQAAWLAEIEPFPSAVLAHHYPDVPNLGDMTQLPAKVLAEEIAAPEVIVGGTPCQAFSVAGLREGLSDPRGQLSIKYVELADAIDAVRARRDQPPAIIVWENVPGVLSDKRNAFGCFLGALSGEDCELQPAGEKWADAGCVFGPKRAIAWRILDAQYFGLAQRRRRVFVIASARPGFDPAAVLFEFDGVRRDTPPSREAGEESAAGTLRSAGGGSDVDHAMAGHIQIAVAKTICAGGYSNNPLDENLLAVGAHPPAIAFPANLSGTQCASTENLAPSLGAKNPTAVAVALRGRDGGATAELGDEVGNCLRASSGGGDKPHVLAPVTDTLCNKGFNALKEGNASTQETYPGTLLRTLRKEVGEEAFAKWGLGILDSLQQAEVLRQALYGLSIRPATFSRSWVVCCALGFTVYGSGWLLQSLREAGCERCSPQGWEPSEQFSRELGAYLSELSQPGAQAARFMRDLWFASEGFGLLQQALLAVQEVGRPANRQGKPVFRNAEGVGAKAGKSLLSSGVQCETSCERVLQQTRSTSKARDARGASEDEGGSGFGQMASGMMVRRLTVEECEFLQGFPRGYTAIPWRNKPATQCPDGPRYKALGNSMAVPVMTWIGQRINNQIENSENGQTEP